MLMFSIKRMNDFTAPDRRVLIKAIILAGLVWAVYANALGGPFDFDDWHVIPDNPSVHVLANVPSFFVDVSQFSVLPGNQDYRPLFLTSMAFAWWLGEGSTLPFHIMSVTLHMANVLLVFLIARFTLVRTRDVRGGLTPPLHEWAAFLAAGLFAVHPLATESVNYISSQSVPLVAFFYLLAFFAFVTGYASEAPRRESGKRLRLAGAYLAYCLALLSKPIGISLPLNLVLWDLLFLGKENHGPGPVWRRHASRLLKHVPFLGISLLYVLIREALFTAPFGGAQEIRSVYIHYLTQTKALVFYYLKLAFVPFGFNADVHYPVVSAIADPWVLSAIVALVVTGGILFRFRAHRNLVFWSTWFVVCLLLTTYGVILRQVVNEHRVYLSLAGICIVAGLLLVRLAGAVLISTPGHKAPRRALRTLVGAGIVGVFLFLGHQTRARNEVWSSGLALWEDAALHDGTWRAHMNYGLALEGAGRGDEALVQFEEAVRLGPYAFAYLNLGHAQVKRGDFEQGIAHLRTAVRLWPSAPEPHLYLGLGLDKQGKTAEAEKEYRRAIALRPRYLRAYRYLAGFYERQDRLADALAQFERLQAFDPGAVVLEVKINRLRQRLSAIGTDGGSDLFREAYALQADGKREEAIKRYERLLKQFPGHRQGTFNLAYAYLQGVRSGDWESSAKLFRKVLEIDATYVEAIHHLASAYWKIGDEEQAAKYDRSYMELGNHSNFRQRSQERLARAASP